MKKALFVATVFDFLDFEKSDIGILMSMGYEVHTATNMYGYEGFTDRGQLDGIDVVKHQIDFGRSPFSSKSIKAYKQLKQLMTVHHFDLIHCHTPVAAAIARLAARTTRKRGTKVVYTDHGFHFHKTSGWKTWVLYYPVEYLMAYFTDMIMTINKEDYGVIQKFHCPIKKYIPGVGVDVERVQSMNPNRAALREEFHIPLDAFLILSVGELSTRKNQEVIIRAIAMLGNPKVYYLLCGSGDKKEYLETLSKEFGVANQVIFAGLIPHDKVLELGYAADLGALPSLIEGLGLAGIEAIAAGRPVIASGLHGIKDYVIDGETGICCEPHNPIAFCAAINRLMEDAKLYQRCCEGARKKALEFDIRHVQELMRENYKEILSK